MAKVLIIEDDDAIREQVEDWLSNKNFVVESAQTGAEGQSRLEQYEYDVIVLDWELPDATGIEILKKLRASGSRTPVLMLTGRGSIDDKETGFDTGADDYLTKPFDLRELNMRIHSLLKRTADSTDSATNNLTFKHITLDPRNFKVLVKEKPVTLHAREFQLLEYLLRHPGQVFSAADLLDRVWHSDSAVGPETVRQCVKRIRKKIDLEKSESIIENIYGVGYRLKLD